MTLALVTGAGGFVGGYLTAELLKRGHSVRAMIRRRADLYVPPRLIELKKIFDLDIVKGDVTNYHDVDQAMHNTGWCFHLASQSFVPDAISNPSYTFMTNALGTQNVLDAARAFNTKLVFASSCEVFGRQEEQELPINEDNVCRPRNPYGISKLHSDYLARNYHSLYNAPNVVARAFNHEGVGRGHYFVTASIIRQLVMVKLGELEHLTIGDTTTTRDWSHVQDMIEAYILLASKGAPGEIYVVGSGRETSVDQFIELTVKLLSLRGVRLKRDPALMRKADVPRLQADASKIKALGWEPKLKLEDVIVEMIAFYYGLTKEQRANV